MKTNTLLNRLVLGTAMLSLAASGFAASAETLPAAPSTTMATATPVPYSQLSGGQMAVREQTSTAVSRVLNLGKGRSAVVDLPVDASDVFVSNPKVADAILRTPRRIFVLGVDAGQSDALFFDRMGRQILNLSIRVNAATDELSDAMHRLFPDSQVEAQSLNGHIVLSGLARDDGEADQILRLAQTFVDKPEDVLNLMSIAGKDQVTLKVRIVEVNRSVIKQLGMNNSITYNFGTRSYSWGQSASYGANGAYQGSASACFGQTGAATINGTTTTSTSNTSGNQTVDQTLTNTGSKIFGTNASNCLQAFERVGLARTLAEPNLTAVSGEAAKFLAGGEFPVPASQDSQGRVTVEFKPFGVGLGFTPVVLSGGRISLKLSTEVSDLTNVGALQTGTGLNIPGLTVRRAETTVEMQSGSSLMIAGLLQSNFKQSIDSLPGLTTLPVLGALFRSRDFLNDETEMVVIVTPYLTSTMSPDQVQTPADNLQTPNDATSVFMGQINKVIADKGAGPASAPPPAVPYQAPIGYVIE
jgi:pilus assembly protein CpaC